MNTININNLYREELEKLTSKFNEKDFYINRELSWIDFNKRVLNQSTRKDVPLLERLKFLGITASNLDEFIMVRFASVLNKILNSPSSSEISGLLPIDEYQIILNKIIEFKDLQISCYSKLLEKLKNNNIYICKYNELNKKEQEYVEKIFIKNIYPLLTPMTYDTNKEFPLIRSKQLNIVVELEDFKNPNLNVLSIISIDKNIDRIYQIETDDDDDSKFILLEEIVFAFLHKIFINKNILYKGCIRIIRQADFELDSNHDVYIIDRMKQILIQREFSDPIFMDIEDNIPKHVLKLLVKIFEIEKKHIYKSKQILDLSFFTSNPIPIPMLEYEQFNPQYPEELIGEHDMFTAIDSNDIILHHPYESFGPVVKFLEHAADDKNVLVIKQTLYRVSSTDSPIVEALCRASENGKQVSVLLEIKARFDEDRNISLIEKLKLAGCKIIYGSEKLKTHAKFILVVKRSSKGLKTYCHLGTGNYNDKTAKLYTDLSYFTSNSKIGEDLMSLFNLLSGFSEPSSQMNKLFFSPYNLRSQIYNLVDREIANVKKGKEGIIILKLNSLSDRGIIKKLYEASEAGVKVSIICRGICSMKAMNPNIFIKSIIGRYLEHSRIYYFLNAGKPDVYISSADFLTRNLDRRVELLTPINDNECKIKILYILDKYFKDKFNSYVMSENGQYKMVKSDPSSFNVQEFFMDEAKNKYKLRYIPKIPFNKKKK